MSDRLVRAYAEHRDLDAARLRYYRLFHCIRHAKWLSERRLGIPGLVRPGVPLGYWSGPESLAGYLAHVHDEMGIRVRVPGS